MTTFARINGGFVTDLQVCTSQELSTRYHPEWLAANPFTVIADGVVAGAEYLGGDVMDAASFQNPPPPVAPPRPPKDLSEIEFITLCQEAGGMTDDQLVACRSDARFAAMWIKFIATPYLSKTDPRVQAGITALAATGYLPNGVDALNANWPQG